MGLIIVLYVASLALFGLSRLFRKLGDRAMAESPQAKGAALAWIISSLALGVIGLAANIVVVCLCIRLLFTVM